MKLPGGIHTNFIPMLLVKFLGGSLSSCAPSSFAAAAVHLESNLVAPKRLLAAKGREAHLERHVFLRLPGDKQHRERFLVGFAWCQLHLDNCVLVAPPSLPGNPFVVGFPVFVPATKPDMQQLGNFGRVHDSQINFERLLDSNSVFFRLDRNRELLILVTLGRVVRSQFLPFQNQQHSRRIALSCVKRQRSLLADVVAHLEGIALAENRSFLELSSGALSR